MKLSMEVYSTLNRDKDAATFVDITQASFRKVPQKKLLRHVTHLNNAVEVRTH